MIMNKKLFLKMTDVLNYYVSYNINLLVLFENYEIVNI